MTVANVLVLETIQRWTTARLKGQQLKVDNINTKLWSAALKGRLHIWNKSVWYINLYHKSKRSFLQQETAERSVAHCVVIYCPNNTDNMKISCMICFKGGISRRMYCKLRFVRNRSVLMFRNEKAKRTMSTLQTLKHSVILYRQGGNSV